MDLLSLLTGLISKPQQQVPRTVASSMNLPNKNQVPVGQPFKTYGNHGITINNVDKPQSLPFFNGSLRTPEVVTNLYDPTVRSSYTPGSQPTLPDHQYQPAQYNSVQTMPARGGEDLLRLLTQGRTGKA